MTQPDPAIYARMVALCEHIAATVTSIGREPTSYEARAIEIMALVNPPVDPDEAEAKLLAKEQTTRKTGGLKDFALVCLKRGRELAKAEQSTEGVELLRRAARFVSDTFLYEEIVPFLARHDKEPS